MRYTLIILSICSVIISYGQVSAVVGTYSSGVIPRIQVTFNADSTFQYATKEQHPTFYRWEDFSEKGRWILSGDTIILNPELNKKIYVESDLREQELAGINNLLLTFNHIKRYFDTSGNIVKADTFQIERLDYAFNEFKKKNRTRVAPNRMVHCTFAGYIPKEIITTSRTISVERPAQNIQRIFIGCYELQGTKEYKVTNPNANHFTLNVYSNYYQDGQIRQVKFLIKNDRVLYTRQKKNGEFEKDNIWHETDAKLKKTEGGI